MNKNKALRLALEALEGVLDDSPKVLDASISGGLYEVVQCRDAITAIKAALETEEHEWEGLTEKEFVYFCSFVDHDTLSQIENILRDKNELRSN